MAKSPSPLFIDINCSLSTLKYGADTRIPKITARELKGITLIKLFSGVRIVRELLLNFVKPIIEPLIKTCQSTSVIVIGLITLCARNTRYAQNRDANFASKLFLDF
jgi:hypothetical protein